MPREAPSSGAGAAIAVGLGLLGVAGGVVWLRSLSTRAIVRRMSDPVPTPVTDGPTSPIATQMLPEREWLGRELASEDSGDAGVQVVIGSITIATAKRRSETVGRLLGGKAGRVGSQTGSGGYASTAEPATAATLRMADALLAGRVQPSAVIRGLSTGLALAWVERLDYHQVGGKDVLRPKNLKGWDSRHMLRLQEGDKGFGGIVGRIASAKLDPDGRFISGPPSQWFLYRQSAPHIPGAGDDETAATLILGAVPVLPAVDDGVRLT